MGAFRQVTWLLYPLNIAPGYPFGHAQPPVAHRGGAGYPRSDRLPGGVAAGGLAGGGGVSGRAGMAESVGGRLRGSADRLFRLRRHRRGGAGSRTRRDVLVSAGPDRRPGEIGELRGLTALAPGPSANPGRGGANAPHRSPSPGIGRGGQGVRANWRMGSRSSPEPPGSKRRVRYRYNLRTGGRFDHENHERERNPRKAFVSFVISCSRGEVTS